MNTWFTSNIAAFVRSETYSLGRFSLQKFDARDSFIFLEKCIAAILELEIVNY